jgi:hypothetical protein
VEKMRAALLIWLEKEHGHELNSERQDTVVLLSF